MPDSPRLALLASPTDRAQEAEAALTASHDWVPLAEADIAVVLGGDGFMLQTLHHMLDTGRVIPAYGLNLGTVGFLMNRHKAARPLPERVARARGVAVAPLWMEALTQTGEQYSSWAINEVSLLRETRQTAKLEVSVNGKVRLPELFCDGVLVSTPAGSTAYNLSASGPILPLGSAMLALTPISPFRPPRWRGAILPESCEILFRSLEADKRPVSVVADQKEVRDISEVRVSAARDHLLTLLFDKGRSLEERIFAEQFLV
ncbi:MAG: NAD kinase [Novosphingobium sp.]|nr:NAD kinase [Novosphingobium sp.]